MIKPQATTSIYIYAALPREPFMHYVVMYNQYYKYNILQYFFITFRVNIKCALVHNAPEHQLIVLLS